MKRTMNVLSLTLILSIAFSNTAFSGFWSTKKVEPTMLEKGIKLIKNPLIGAAALTATCIAGLIWLNKGPKADAPVAEQSTKEETKAGFFSYLAKPFVATKNYVSSLLSSKEKTEDKTVKTPEIKKPETKIPATIQNGACKSGKCSTGKCSTGKCSTGKCSTGKCGRGGKSNGSRNPNFFGKTVI